MFRGLFLLCAVLTWSCSKDGSTGGLPNPTDAIVSQDTSLPQNSTVSFPAARESDTVPNVGTSAQLVLTVDETLVRLDSVRGYVVGFPSILEIQRAKTGQLFISGIPQGRYDVILFGISAANSSNNLDRGLKIPRVNFLAGNRTQLSDVKLRALGSMSGLVQSRSNLPVGAVKVLFPGIHFGATTGEDGTFSISGVPAGTYRLMVEKSDLSRGLVPDAVVVDGLDTKIPSITLFPHLEPDGIVMINGAPNSSAISRTVTVTAGFPADVDYMKVSQDQALADASWIPARSSFSWTFLQEGVQSLFIQGRSPEGATTGIFKASVRIDTFPEAAIGVKLNDGAAISTQRSVTAGLKYPDGTQTMQVAFSSNFDNANWEPAAVSKVMSLAGEGTNTVCARFKNRDGDVSEATCDQIEVDLFPESEGALQINNGDSVALLSTVMLTLSLPANAVEMIISDRSDFSGASWQAVATSKSFSFLGEGSFTVYAKFREASGVLSHVVSDSIDVRYFPPEVGGVTIDSGNFATESSTVPLTIAAPPNATQMLVSTNQNFSGANWTDVATSISNFVLDSGKGRKSVFARFRNSQGHLSPIFEDSILIRNRYTSVSAGSTSTCAVTNSGSVFCWGGGNNIFENFSGTSSTKTSVSENTFGRYAVSAAGVIGTGGSAIAGGTHVDVGFGHACAVVSGAARCWGNNTSYQLGTGNSTTYSFPNLGSVSGLSSGVSKVTVGDYFSCAVDPAGVKCWGYNSDGQLGNGTTSTSSTPVSVSGASGFLSVDAGRSHVCALTSAGGVWCWGSGGSGQLGNGNLTNSSTPVQVTGLASGVLSVSAGGSSSCALLSGGIVKCWGANGTGQLGNGRVGNSSIPVDVVGLPSDLTSVSVGFNHSCATSSQGYTYCWGYGYDGRLGNGTNSSYVTPQFQPTAEQTFTDIVGGVSGCRVSQAGALECWGNGDLGELGNGSFGYSSLPTPVVDAASGMRSVKFGGSYFACSISQWGGVRCWGRGQEGQLGNGNLSDYSVPTDVIGLASGVTDVALGNSHACALTSRGAVKCWGQNTYGQIGNGNNIQYVGPQDVIGLGYGVAKIKARDNRTCALLTSKRLACWGDGSSTPSYVSGLDSNIIDFTLGSMHACALTNDGAVYCWGNTGSGRLGNGIVGNYPLSIADAVTGLSSGVARIAAGHSHTCALMTTGGLKCWGVGNSGQVGNGNFGDALIPADVVGLTKGVTSILASGNNTCAIVAGAELKCWGTGYPGLLGNGSSTSSSIPVSIHGLEAGVSKLNDDLTCALLTSGRIACWGQNGSSKLGLNGSNTYHPVRVLW